MQIGRNLFIDIEVDGMNLTNFLKVGDLLDCKIVETAGASLPYAYVKFLTFDEKVMNSIQLGNKVKLSIGNSSSDKDTFELNLIPSQPNKEGSGNGWVVEFAGFMGNLNYMVNQISKSYLGNSMLVVNQVIKETLGDGVKVFNDFTEVRENQVYWMRNNKTASSFVAHVLTHADVRPSFPLFTFDKYGNFYIKDINKMLREGPKYIFSSASSTKTNQYQYFNNFNPDNYKQLYNIYSGYNKITEISNASSGIPNVVVDENVPILAASSEAEESYAGNVVQMNDIQSDNVHKTYHEAFVYNTNKLMALSSLMGHVIFLEKYHREFKPLDLISMLPEGAKDSAFSGRYLIDTVVTEADFHSGGIRTYVFVTRDNKNNVENYSFTKLLATPLNKGITIFKNRRDSILGACTALKTVYAMALSFIDGTFLRRLLDFAIRTKNSVLQSFALGYIIQDMTRKERELRSLVLSGNSLMNSLLNMLFPSDIFAVCKDFIIVNPTLKSVVLDYLITYTPTDIVDVALLLVDNIFTTTNQLNNVAKDNKIYIWIGDSKLDTIITSGEDIKDYKPISYSEERQPEVNNIIESFEDNTVGLDIPFPMIVLTESEALLPKEDLKDLIADKTIDNLDKLQYLENVDKTELKRILLGQQAINFNIIDAINKSAGDVFSYRYWGTYREPLELTNFMIKESFKDKYRTIPCTKIISATDNKRIWFCCPKAEEDLKFYINSKRVELLSFDVDLGHVNAYKIPVPYTIYYTDPDKDGYNSNSVLLEVKQKTMV